MRVEGTCNIVIL